MGIGLESPVSQLKAGPSDTGTAAKLSGEATAPGEAKPSAAPAAAPGAASLDFASLTPPWQVRHARKLIVAAALLAASVLAFFSYYAWWLQSQPFNRMRWQPAVPAAQLQVTAPAPAADQPSAVVPKVTTSRPSPPVAPVAVPPTGPRVPAVTHTLRDEPKSATAAPAVVPAVAAPAPAAPSDCPDGIAALGLCASHKQGGMK